MKRSSVKNWIMAVGLPLLLTASLAGAQTATFRSARLFSLPGTNLDATGLAVLADVASASGGPDGKLDLITASQAQQLTVLYGRGDGTFSAGPSTDLSLIPTAMTLADVTGDQVLDVLIGDNGNTVSVWRGKNDGTFELVGDPVDVGLIPRGIAVADVDRNGKVDVIAAGDVNQQSGGVRVLFGNNDASLTPALETVNAGLGSSGVVAGDFNRDNKIDLAVSNEISNDVSILRGDGGGGFTLVQSVAVGDSPVAIDSDDCNSDQRLDLVVANSNSDTISVIDGRADGSFAAARSFVSGSSASTPLGLSLGDVNGDGHPDAVVVNNFSFDVGVLYGNATGQFSAPFLFVVDAEPVGLAVGDLNGDGADDVVGVTRGAGNTPTAGVLLSLGDGLLNGVQNLIIDVNPTQIVAADLNTDGLPDLAVSQNGTGSQPGSLRVVYAHPDGTFFGAQSLVASGDASGVASGDFNGDGRLDLAVINRSTSNVSVFLTRAAGGFSSVGPFPIGAGVNAVCAGDWNRDGRTDLAVTLQSDSNAGTLQTLLANASGGFGTPASTTVGQLPVAVESGDFNGDGRLDIVTANSASNNVSIALGNGNGTFQAATSVAVAGGPRSVAVADFDRDGFEDLAVSLSLTPSAVVLYGDGTGRFPNTSRPLSVGGSDIPSSVAARDVNGDGNPDVMIGVEVASTIRTFLRAAAPNTRAFTTADIIGVNRRPISLVTADFDGDGRYDAAAAASSPAPTASVLTNIRATTALRGDGNGDGAISAADAVAVMRKVVEGAPVRVEDVGVRGYVASRGVDANGDGIVTPPDALAVSSLTFNRQFLGL